MPGDHWQQFANLRALLGYMYGHPGKQLLFMGVELGQWTEWSHERSLDWGLLEYAPHHGLQRWIMELNRLHRVEPALHEVDFESAGFEWIDGADTANAVVSFVRRDRAGAAFILVICNFTPVPREHYRIGVPEAGRWDVIANGDAQRFGGSGYPTPTSFVSSPIAQHGRAHSIEVTLPPLATLFLKLRVEAS